MSEIKADNYSLNEIAINNFREYLKIPSVHPNVNYNDCVKFLEKQAKELFLLFRTFYCFPNKPVVVLTKIGLEPELPSIMLSSHMDVVPVFEEKWTHKPFDAEIDEKGNIYARGAQDMKCVAIQYLEAIRRLNGEGTIFNRTIHLVFTPDEEISGIEGMKAFVKSNEFQELNVGFALDEGMASPTNDYVLFYGERCIWYLVIHCPGQPGHGSLLHKNTAGETVQQMLNKLFQFRKEQQTILEKNSSLTIGDVTSMNVTQLQGGVQPNVVPPEFVIVVDCRIPVTVDVTKWEKTLNQWCQEAGDGVWIEYKQKQPQVAVTKLDSSNPFWMAFEEAAKELKIELKPQIFPGGTDSRYIRGVDIPALGFSPMNNTPVLLHDHNEYLNKDVFLKGIEVYCKIIPALANVPDITE